jgi:hypothetical protein
MLPSSVFRLRSPVFGLRPSASVLRLGPSVFGPPLPSTVLCLMSYVFCLRSFVFPLLASPPVTQSHTTTRTRNSKFEIRNLRFRYPKVIRCFTRIHQKPQFACEQECFRLPSPVSGLRSSPLRFRPPSWAFCLRPSASGYCLLSTVLCLPSPVFRLPSSVFRLPPPGFSTRHPISHQNPH